MLLQRWLQGWMLFFHAAFPLARRPCIEINTGRRRRSIIKKNYPARLAQASITGASVHSTASAAAPAAVWRPDARERSAVASAAYGHSEFRPETS